MDPEIYKNNEEFKAALNEFNNFGFVIKKLFISALLKQKQHTNKNKTNNINIIQHISNKIHDNSNKLENAEIGTRLKYLISAYVSSMFLPLHYKNAAYFRNKYCVFIYTAGSVISDNLELYFTLLNSLKPLNNNKMYIINNCINKVNTLFVNINGLKLTKVCYNSEYHSDAEFSEKKLIFKMFKTIYKLIYICYIMLDNANITLIENIEKKIPLTALFSKKYPDALLSVYFNRLQNLKPTIENLKLLLGTFLNIDNIIKVDVDSNNKITFENKPIVCIINKMSKIVSDFNLSISCFYDE